MQFMYLLPENSAGRSATLRICGWVWGWLGGANIIFLEVDEPQSPAHPQLLHPACCL